VGSELVEEGHILNQFHAIGFQRRVVGAMVGALRLLWEFEVLLNDGMMSK